MSAPLYTLPMLINYTAETIKKKELFEFLRNLLQFPRVLVKVVSKVRKYEKEVCVYKISLNISYLYKVFLHYTIARKNDF